MNERTLSEKLEDIANKLKMCDNVYQAYDIADEILALSVETYAPGNSLSWRDVKPPKKNATRTDKNGRIQPF